MKLTQSLAGTALLVSAVGCASSSSPVTTAATPEPSRVACQSALPHEHVLNGTATTLAEVRRHREGPGNRPYDKALPTKPGRTVAYWCWVDRGPRRYKSFVVSGTSALPGVDFGSPTVPTGEPLVP